MNSHKISVEGFTEEQLEKAIEELGSAVRCEVDASCERINKLLNCYGLACKMQIVIDTPANLNQLHDRIKSEQDN